MRRKVKWQNGEIVKPEPKREYLTAKQRAFARAYAADPEHNAVAAYLAAGYDNNKGAVSEAKKLLEHPAIQEYLSKRVSVVETRSQLGLLEKQKQCLDFWSTLLAGDRYHDEKISIKHRLEASQMLAKACGLWNLMEAQKVPRTTNVTVNAEKGAPTRIEFVDPYSREESSPTLDAVFSEHKGGERDD